METSCVSGKRIRYRVAVDHSGPESDFCLLLDGKPRAALAKSWAAAASFWLWVTIVKDLF
ncbi:hypothetical protein DSO57_1003640 [Entomophthora muscae]|uniref:Uncharacterized protein n=1 Tax=Entomophthora muscae TaxID=34485 RepID=A0ACC2SLF0_9FUNG|nr:hypothetical protein DSO57_1003640 [Entomophthora muscae]